LFTDFTWGDLELEMNNGKYINLALFNSLTGSILALDGIISTYPAGDRTDPNAIAADGKGNYYIGAHFGSNAYVGEDTFVRMDGNTDWLVVKYGPEDCDCSLPDAAFTVGTTSSGS